MAAFSDPSAANRPFKRTPCLCNIEKFNFRIFQIEWPPESGASIANSERAFWSGLFHADPNDGFDQFDRGSPKKLESFGLPSL